jgi:hypothetical protein
VVKPRPLGPRGKHLGECTRLGDLSEVQRGMRNWGERFPSLFRPRLFYISDITDGR